VPQAALRGRKERKEENEWSVAYELSRERGGLEG